MTVSPWRPDDTREIAELIKDIDICMFVTRSNGSVRGRPMSNNGKVEYDGDSWFFPCDDTRMVADIVRDPQVGLGYQGKAGALGLRPFFVAVEGRAALIRDEASFAEHWTKGLDRWFEQGIDTPGLVLIKVSAERLHYWDGNEEGELKLAEQAEA